MITRGQPAGTSVMGAGPRDGLVCFSGTLGKTHPGKCISEAFWNVLRTCWSGRILADQSPESACSIWCCVEL